MTYGQKLKDPRWQKKRLEVLNNAGWKCQSCGTDDAELHVHHVIYEKGCDPWDYEDGNFRCLCARCHSKTETAIHAFRQFASFGDSMDCAGFAICLSAAKKAFWRAGSSPTLSEVCFAAQEMEEAVVRMLSGQLDDFTEVREKADRVAGFVLANRDLK